jgi:hypothetical protein
VHYRGACPERALERRRHYVPSATKHAEMPERGTSGGRVHERRVRGVRCTRPTRRLRRKRLLRKNKLLKMLNVFVLIQGARLEGPHPLPERGHQQGKVLLCD